MNFLTRYNELGQKFSVQEVKATNVRRALRVNSLKISEKELVRRMLHKGAILKKIPYLKEGYFYESKFSLGSTQEYLQGYYYLQEAASQIPAQELEPKKGEIVLDMAASPGSKTTQIAQLMENKGVIVALDNDKRRLESLKNNLERLSITNAILLKKDARFVSDLNIKFDRILLDAPCSGNFCIEPDYFSKRSLNDLHQKSKVQKELLGAAVKSLKSGGIIVYSTCSLEPEEDELVIDWALKNFPDLAVQPIKAEVGEPGATNVFGKELHKDIALTKKLWPHKTGTEGFFVAKLRKK